MNIRYQTRKLEKSVENLSAIRRYYGDRAKKVALRLEQLAAAANLDALRILPSSNCHELKADRVGEIAVDISPNHRIIFIGLDWKSVTGIVIMAIGEDYH
jgi:plasmid maintenance system killer protein